MKHLEAFYKGKNILVTGGAGFIGSHIAQALVGLGARVTILDNFSAGNLSNLSSVFTYINLQYADITSAYSCLQAAKNKDIVFHLAAFTSVPGSIANPDLCTKINVLGTKNILEACKDRGVKTFIYSSSAAVYGNKTEDCTETDPTNPQSPYASSKVLGEKLCKEYSDAMIVSTACLRYFNVYGDRQNPNGSYAAAVAKFKHNLLNKKPITIYGDGTQTRDFVHVSDVVKANLNIAMLENMKGDIYNIGSGKSMNLLELIEKLELELNIKKTDITFESRRAGDIVHSNANCSKYKNLVF
ncbi:MAG: NAD-dependent epimerase/dehydratase family protein [bacterium]